MWHGEGVCSCWGGKGGGSHWKLIFHVARTAIAINIFNEIYRIYVSSEHIDRFRGQRKCAIVFLDYEWHPRSPPRHYHQILIRLIMWTFIFNRKMCGPPIAMSNVDKNEFIAFLIILMAMHKVRNRWSNIRIAKSTIIKIALVPCF